MSILYLKVYLPFSKVFETESKFILVLSCGLFPVKQVLEEDIGHLHWPLVHRCPYTAL